jgi:hypothetical protein
MKNTSNKPIFNPENLEKLLIKSWTDFIEARKLLNFIVNYNETKFHYSKFKIQTLLVSNCELKPEGITLWISYNIVKYNENVNVTNEILLNIDGTISVIDTT